MQTSSVQPPRQHCPLERGPNSPQPSHSHMPASPPSQPRGHQSPMNFPLLGLVDPAVVGQRLDAAHGQLPPEVAHAAFEIWREREKGAGGGGRWRRWMTERWGEEGEGRKVREGWEWIVTEGWGGEKREKGVLAKINQQVYTPGSMSILGCDLDLKWTGKKGREGEWPTRNKSCIIYTCKFTQMYT